MFFFCIFYLIVIRGYINKTKLNFSDTEMTFQRKQKLFCESISSHNCRKKYYDDLTDLDITIVHFICMHKIA